MTDAASDISTVVPRPDVAGVLRRSVWPTADQGLIAAANFAAIVLVGRQLSVEAFGTYTLVYSLIYFANSVQLGLITQPHSVLGATRDGEDYVRYTSSTAVSQCAMVVTAAFLFVVAGLVARLMGLQVAVLLAAAAPATLAWQLQEFVRRVLYTEDRFFHAFVCDVLGYGGQVLGMVLLWQGGALSGATALGATAVAHAVAAAYGAACLRRSIVQHFSLGDVLENWHFGKWIAGGTVISEWLSAQMLVYLASALLGVVAAGVLRSVHTLFGPARILAQVISITVPTRLARTLHAQGEQALRTHFNQIALTAMPVLGIYCLLAAIFARPLLTFVFGEKYRDYGGVVALYAVSAWLTYGCILLSAALRARRLTRAVFVGEVIYLLVIPIGVALIPLWKLHGVVVGLIIGDLAVLAYLWQCHMKAASSEAERTAVGEGMECIEGTTA